MKRIIATAVVAACALAGVALFQGAGIASAQGVGVSGYEVVLRESALETTAFRQVTANCPTGKRAVGGGFAVVNNTGAILDGQAVYSMPSYDGSGWMVNARSLAPATARWRLQVRVICVNVG